MPPAEKKFVKYTFEQGNNKPRQPRKQSKDNFKQRDNNQQTRTRRHVSYTEKPSRQNVLKDMINTFTPIQKPSSKLEQMMKKFPKYFNSTPKEPEPWNPELLNPYLALMGKKINEREVKTFVPIQIQEEQDPDWDSSSDDEMGIESKRIDQKVVEKAMQKIGVVKQLRQDELKRHQKQFLEDYYRQKHQELIEKQKTQTPNMNSQNNDCTGENQAFNQWTEYQQKQVEDFVNMGFIQKIEEDDNDDFGDDDFSVEDQKSQSQKSETSSEGDDNIFGDEGPTTIVKKKVQTDQASEQKQTNMGTVVINNHVFSRIAQTVGIPPGACIWIIRNNKNLRYKVSTQFMDEMYRLNNFCESLPYVSLNHSEFVHNADVQKQRGLQIFKKFNARKQEGSQHPHQKSGTGQRNYEINKRKFQYNQKISQNISQKSHLNKK